MRTFISICNTGVLWFAWDHIARTGWEISEHISVWKDIPDIAKSISVIQNCPWLCLSFTNDLAAFISLWKAEDHIIYVAMSWGSCGPDVVIISRFFGSEMSFSWIFTLECLYDWVHSGISFLALSVWIDSTYLTVRVEDIKPREIIGWCHSS